MKGGWKETLHLASRLLLRDWRAGELTVLVSALLVAVTAMTGVAFLTDRVGQAVEMRAAESLDDVTALETFREEINDTCESYMADLAESLKRLKQFHTEEEYPGAEARVLEPLAQLEKTVSTLRELDFETAPEPAVHLAKEVESVSSVSAGLVEWMESIN